MDAMPEENCSPQVKKARASLKNVLYKVRENIELDLALVLGKKEEQIPQFSNPTLPIIHHAPIFEKNLESITYIKGLKCYMDRCNKPAIRIDKSDSNTALVDPKNDIMWNSINDYQKKSVNRKRRINILKSAKRIPLKKINCNIEQLNNHYEEDFIVPEPENDYETLLYTENNSSLNKLDGEHENTENISHESEIHLDDVWDWNLFGDDYHVRKQSHTQS